MGVAAPFMERNPLTSTEIIPREDGQLRRTQQAGTPGPVQTFDPMTDPRYADQTLVDLAPPGAAAGLPAAGAAPPQRTLLGVARPGIAPIAPGVSKTPIDRREDPPSYVPLGELGATHRFAQVSARAPEPDQPAHPLGRRRHDQVQFGRVDKRGRAIKPVAPLKSESGSRRSLVLLAAAAMLSAGGIAVALLWPSKPTLAARVRSAEGGSEVLELACDSCPDGTKLSARDAETIVRDRQAILRLDAPLPIGDTELKVAIDRPSSGRDESVKLPVRVAYRVRPDLSTLDGDTPSLQVIVEAMPGSKVRLEGEAVELREGRAVKTIDVSADLRGASSDAGLMLSRRLTFDVKPPDQAEERGVVAVSVPIAPLVIDAPGRAVVTDKSTFLLAGSTIAGAEVVVSGRPIAVSKEGGFSQAMNVSSVGTTEIEVRAKMSGRAPRLVRLRVERTSSLAKAAQEFEKSSPLSYDSAVLKKTEAIERPVLVAGEVLEVKRQASRVVAIVAAEGASCGERRCLVRLRQGQPDLAIERGGKIRAYGVVAGSVVHDGKEVLDVDVAFSLFDAPKPSGTPSPSGTIY